MYDMQRSESPPIKRKRAVLKKIAASYDCNLKEGQEHAAKS
jgi:hypothetical protein